MKLKTLKNLDWIEDLDNKDDRLLSFEEIKTEAIKWVKHFESLNYIEMGKWEFMKFHNITEGDLK